MSCSRHMVPRCSHCSLTRGQSRSGNSEVVTDQFEGDIACIGELQVEQGPFLSSMQETRIRCLLTICRGKKILLADGASADLEGPNSGP